MVERKKIYMCHPYNHKERLVMRMRFQSANDLAARLMRSGMIVFSPISHSVPISGWLRNHRSHDFWLTQDLAWLMACDEVWVPLVDGWANSRGIDIETSHAAFLGKPIVYFRPDGTEGYRVCGDEEVRQSMVAAALPSPDPDPAGNGGLPDLYP